MKIYHSRIRRECLMKYLYEIEKQYLTFTLFNTRTVFISLSYITVCTKTTDGTHMIAWWSNMVDISTCFLTWYTTTIEFFIPTTYFTMKR